MLNNRNIQILFFVLLVIVVIIDLKAGLSYLVYIALVLAYLPFVIYGSSVIQANYFFNSKCKGSHMTKTIAITFDDGPSAGHTEGVLDILKIHRAPAAFFVIGKNIAGQEALVKRMDDEGHIVGNHSYTHNFWFSMKSEKDMLLDLQKCDTEIERVTGKRTLLFRPPYGVTNPMVASAVRNGHYTSIGWSLRTFDTTAKDREKLLHKALSNLRNGDVVLFHDWAQHTVSILSDFIVAARAAGFEIVRADELLGVKPYI